MPTPATKSPTVWTAIVHVLTGHHWKSFDGFAVIGSTAHVAARAAVLDVKRQLPKRTRIAEVKAHLIRAPKPRPAAEEVSHG